MSHAKAAKLQQRYAKVEKEGTVRWLKIPSFCDVAVGPGRLRSYFLVCYLRGSMGHLRLVYELQEETVAKKKYTT